MTIILILLTWLVWIGAFIGIGSSLARICLPQLPGSVQWRVGMWTGLMIVLASVSFLQLWIGLGTRIGAAISTLILILGNLALLAQVLHSRKKIVASLRGVFAWRRSPILIVLTLFALGLLDMAYLATGEPMDADAGSYRIGAILYASEYKVLPGLANLHFRFGFNSSMWPFAAAIGNGLWTGQGYRIVTGVFVAALVADIALRLTPRRRGPSKPGDWFMILGTTFTGGVILTDAGRWIPSPGQDIAFLCLSLASYAMFADYLASRRTTVWLGKLAILVAASAAMIRPLGWIMAGVMLMVVLATNVRSSTSPGRAFWGFVPTVGGMMVLFSIMASRDVILTGWILYPLDTFAMPVSWISASGDTASEGITAYARAPSLDQQTALRDSSWFLPWLSTFSNSREIFFLRLMAVGCALPLFWRAGRTAWRASWREISLALIPAVTSTFVWFFWAPDLRFGWAGLVALIALPSAFLLAAGAYPAMATKTLGPLALAAFMWTQFQNGMYAPRGGPTQVTEPIDLGPASITLEYAPPPTPDFIIGSLGDGTIVKYPAQGGNCYDIFPLCLLPGTGSDVRSRGPAIIDGFERMTSN